MDELVKEVCVGWEGVSENKSVMFNGYIEGATSVTQHSSSIRIRENN